MRPNWCESMKKAADHVIQEGDFPFASVDLSKEKVLVFKALPGYSALNPVARLSAVLGHSAVLDVEKAITKCEFFSPFREQGAFKPPYVLKLLNSLVSNSSAGGAGSSSNDASADSVNMDAMEAAAVQMLVNSARDTVEKAYSKFTTADSSTKASMLGHYHTLSKVALKVNSNAEVPLANEAVLENALKEGIFKHEPDPEVRSLWLPILLYCL